MELLALEGLEHQHEGYDKTASNFYILNQYVVCTNNRRVKSV